MTISNNGGVPGQTTPKDDDQQTLKHQSVATEATRRYGSAASCTQHNYLTRKGIQPYGIKIEGDKLLIPMHDTEGTIHSLQTIMPNGTKRFMAGGRVKGCYFAIGEPKDLLIVCEEFATGASFHECLNLAVAVAFNAGNLEAVATALHAKYPSLGIIIVANDDFKNPR